MSQEPLSPLSKTAPQQQVVDRIDKIVRLGCKVVHNDRGEFLRSYLFHPLSGTDHPAVLIPTENVLWKFVHRDELPDPEGSSSRCTTNLHESSYLSIIFGARRTLRITGYIRIQLEKAILRLKAGFPGWEPIAVVKAIDFCDRYARVIAEIEDQATTQLKLTMDDGSKEQLNNFLKVFDESWLRLAGVPVGGSLLDD